MSLIRENRRRLLLKERRSFDGDEIEIVTFACCQMCVID